MFLVQNSLSPVPHPGILPKPDPEEEKSFQTTTFWIEIWRVYKINEKPTWSENMQLFKDVKFLFFDWFIKKTRLYGRRMIWLLPHLYTLTSVSSTDGTQKDWERQIIRQREILVLYKSLHTFFGTSIMYVLLSRLLYSYILSNLSWAREMCVGGGGGNEPSDFGHEKIEIWNVLGCDGVKRLVHHGVHQRMEL